jgi:hypothetical protein
MAKWARVVGGVLVDVTSVDPVEMFPADLGDFIVVPDDCVAGACLVDGVWQNPADQPPMAVFVVPPTVSKVRFTFFLWTPAEWLGALARKDADPMLAFYLGMLNSPDVSVIDLSLQEVQAAIDYILTALAPDIVPADQKAARFAKILEG